MIEIVQNPQAPDSRLPAPGSQLPAPDSCLPAPDFYHFIGIGGIGMSGLARILLSRQAGISGSDIASNYVTEGLMKAGVKIHLGHCPDNIPPGSKVVYSSDIKKENCEYQHAVKMNYPLLHRSDLLAYLASEKKSLAITGTHGKTTTASLLTTVLVEAGMDPSFAIGGILPALQTNARGGQGDSFVLEADESDGTFLKYFPKGAIITNIDNDHLNHYGTTEALVSAFETFADQVGCSEWLFWCGDDPLLTTLTLKGSSYGFSDHCAWRGSRFRQVGWHLIFDIEGDGRQYADVEVSLSGYHNALNALAVFALATRLAVPESAIRSAFRAFSGVKRRCERKGELAGALLLDDYAHHPTELAATLKGIRAAVSLKESWLIAVFQPHRYTRTRDCLGMYGNVFDAADEVVVTDVYGAGEDPIDGVTHREIMEEIRVASGIPCRYVPRKDLAAELAPNLKPQDVMVTLGAGDVTQVCDEVISYYNAMGL